MGPDESIQIFHRLQEASTWSQFATSLAAMKTLRFPTDLETFQTFLGTWPALHGAVEGIRKGQSEAIASLRAQLDDTPLLDALREVDGPFGDTVRAAGFSLSAVEAETLADEVERLNQILRIEATINNPGVRQKVAALRDVLPGDVTLSMIWDLLRSRDRAEWFLEAMQENELETSRLTPDGLESLARQRAHTRLLRVAEQQTSDAGGGLLGIGMRMTWLALVSMLVCAVGIANAMLMSVTERFREIATLKCLGALDGFIMSLFLIEACLLGLVGGVGGALAGFVLAGGRMALMFRVLMVQAFPWSEVATAAGISVVLGMVLAAVSAAYPSLRAARLAPMEAMRIE